ncbi:hypothetical protein [Lachnoclostridium sp. An138]|uniref:hypothetical protein n=1 Tax=Lachnoclostridium sp. An138 TaxID=1965560 RepID=UPI000B3773F8|nr:hypothetical protein [Lachnoclostridium sp. An138]OUQ17754.1 hypothetical protein B5E82_09995 [Lachnoclostridium sp. An138]
MKEEEKKVSYYKKCCERPHEAPEFCKEGIQHYADLIMKAINPMEIGDTLFAVVALEKCAECISRQIPEELKSLKEVLSGIKPSMGTIDLSNMSPEEIEALMQQLYDHDE